MKFSTLTTAALAATISVSSYADLTVSNGDYHTIINDNGTLIVSGSSYHAQLGLGTGIVNLTEPVELQLESLAVDVDADTIASGAVLDDGRVQIWGWTLSGEIGFPTVVDGLSSVTDIEVSLSSAYVLIAGEVFEGWSTDGSTWTKVEGLENIVGMEAARESLVAWDANGNAFAYGKNTYGQMGALPDVTQYAVQLNLPPVSKISLSKKHTAALTLDGTVYTVGNNTYGMTGLGSDTYYSSFQLVPNLTNIIDVTTTGARVTMVLHPDGTVSAAGWHNIIKGSMYKVSRNGFELIPEISGVDAFTGSQEWWLVKGNGLYPWGQNDQFRKLFLDGSVVETHYPQLAYESLYVPEVVVSPTINDVRAGGSYIITGSDFGDETGTVMMDGFEFDIKSWANDEVHIENPPVSMTGILVLIDVNGNISNEWLVSLEPDAPSDTPIPQSGEEDALACDNVTDRIKTLRTDREVLIMTFKAHDKKTRKQFRAKHRDAMKDLKVQIAELREFRRDCKAPKKSNKNNGHQYGKNMKESGIKYSSRTGEKHKKFN